MYIKLNNLLLLKGESKMFSIQRKLLRRLIRLNTIRSNVIKLWNLMFNWHKKVKMKRPKTSTAKEKSTKWIRMLSLCFRAFIPVHSPPSPLPTVERSHLIAQLEQSFFMFSSSPSLRFTFFSDGRDVCPSPSPSPSPAYVQCPNTINAKNAVLLQKYHIEEGKTCIQPADICIDVYSTFLCL